MEKRIVVCGGSKGIGAAAIQILLERGFKIILLSRSIGELESIQESNSDLLFIPTDISDKNSRRNAIDEINKFDNIFGIINNASGPAVKPFTDSLEEDYLNAFNMHLFAANDIVISLLPKLKANQESRIVNIISVTARVPLENYCVSNTLRGAMLNWSKTLSKELGKYNITVNNVLPGYTETSRLLEVINGNSARLGVGREDYSSEMLKQVPLGRFGQPREVGAVVAFLFSDDASFISGVSIPVDGGWTPVP
jgi:3-oxoacyl-[acyl-carrier protein] reductase